MSAGIPGLPVSAPKNWDKDMTAATRIHLRLRGRWAMGERISVISLGYHCESIVVGPTGRKVTFESELNLFA